MRTPKKRLNGTSSVVGEVKPSALSLALIRQFVKSVHVERDLSIPDNILFIN